MRTIATDPTRRARDKDTNKRDESVLNRETELVIRAADAVEEYREWAPAHTALLRPLQREYLRLNRRITQIVGPKPTHRQLGPAASDAEKERAKKDRLAALRQWNTKKNELARAEVRALGELAAERARVEQGHPQPPSADEIISKVSGSDLREWGRLVNLVGHELRRRGTFSESSDDRSRRTA